MSESATSAKPAGSKEDGISKYMRRMKTVLKGGTRSNRNSISSFADITGDSSKAKASTSSPTAKASATVTTVTKKAEPMSAQEKTNRWSSMREEKARALFAKYGLTLEPGEWVTPRSAKENVDRVEKPIRMRVRRNCHRCLTTFGPEKVCVGCSHIRCKKCFRYPPAKSKEECEAKGKAREVEKIEEIQPKEKKFVLTIPSRTGGQDLVRKPIMQRVRRTCHMCSTLFIGSATECQNCHHIRCKKCPRDPAKKHKYPDGYPGDAEPPYEPPERVWRKPRRRVRWTCHSCSALFPSGEKICPQCEHGRCQDCTRDPPKKIKPEPDPELLRRVEERLAALDVS
ncbi:hypothetical protein D8B26_002443 [Coccidioides posadasii str. Silveira]|uniref:Uncharacterized protein n=2 Tax=Coccidioides posadasii TaxID=199306 RepID=E9DHG5_COCPS|nr:conserved hypothetical protein [Coccidioides posadasii str. Silveira]KMM65877.1 hypothetical protein CPAG_02217 [Coccidioides posadasii RMSCC 3488]QVM07752.1 hypothetical protein D8B26_002443 [Coccidioides posadasii str. Silveira]